MIYIYMMGLEVRPNAQFLLANIRGEETELQMMKQESDNDTIMGGLATSTLNLH